MRKKINSKKGFTLTEVLVSSSIAVAVMGFSASLMNTVTQITTKNTMNLSIQSDFRTKVVKRFEGETYDIRAVLPTYTDVNGVTYTTGENTIVFTTPALVTDGTYDDDCATKVALAAASIPPTTFIPSPGVNCNTKLNFRRQDPPDAATGATLTNDQTHALDTTNNNVVIIQRLTNSIKPEENKKIRITAFSGSLNSAKYVTTSNPTPQIKVHTPLNGQGLVRDIVLKPISSGAMKGTIPTGFIKYFDATGAEILPANINTTTMWNIKMVKFTISIGQKYGTSTETSDEVSFTRDLFAVVNNN